MIIKFKKKTVTKIYPYPNNERASAPVAPTSPEDRGPRLAIEQVDSASRFACLFLDNGQLKRSKPFSCVLGRVLSIAGRATGSKA